MIRPNRAFIIGLAAERLDRLRHQRVDRGSVRKIARQRDMIAAQTGAEAFKLVDIAPRHRQPGALRGQRVGDCRAEPAARSGHQRGHPRKIEHHAISFASASTSSMVTMLRTFTSGALRLTIGPSTLPPNSMKSSTPPA